MTPTVISDKYEVIGKIGQGGMGTVYKVRHKSLHTIMALKLLPDPGNPDLVGRFLREARVMARLQHDNIVKVFDITQDKNLLYLLEEFVEGDNLSDYIKTRGPLPLLELLEISRQLADALAYAHAQGVIHRDITPRNILIEAKRPLRARLIDFGIAKVEDAGDRTQTGVMLGTLKYSAPEQMGYRGRDGKSVVDGRADIYALGLVIFEMCEGAQFFAGLEQHEIIGRVVYSHEPLVPKFSRQVAARFVALVSRAICREPAERFQSMAELLSAIEDCLKSLSNDQQTMVLPIHPLTKPTADSVTDQEIDARIRALETERQRRLALAAQDKVRAAREHAASAAAGQTAAPRFRQGLDQEEQASLALREGDYLRACDLLDQAAQLFTQAASEAAATQALRDMEKARGDMMEARREAEREGAPDAARTLYGRGLTLEAEAEDHRNQQHYQQAGQTYVDARRFYEQAREHTAVAQRRAAAERAGAATQTARAAALESGAEEFASAALQDAQRQESRAQAAFSEDEFMGAQQLFAAATRDYERAATAAREQRLQRAALAAREEVGRSKAAALDAQAPRYAPDTHEHAQRLDADAERLLAAHSYEAAIAGFADTAASFQQATAEALEARQREAAAKELANQRQRAEEAQRNAAAARTAAEHAAPEEARPEYTEGVTQEEHATAALQEGNYVQAHELFDAAARLFAEATSQAAAARALRESEQARDAMLDAKRHAESERAPDMARTLYDRALTLETNADEHRNRRLHTEAKQTYLQARVLFQQAGDTARSAAQRGAADGARAQMHRIRAAALQSNAEQFAASAVQEARDVEARAETALARAEFATATQLFATAEAAYEQAGKRADEGRLRQEAVSAQDSARRARDAATEAHAPRYARRPYQEGVKLLEEAARSFQAQAYGAATTACGRSIELFQQATTKAAAAQQREEAEAARTRMLALRDEAERAHAAKNAAETYARACAGEERAGTALRDGDAPHARDLFQEAGRVFQEAASAATRAAQNAEEARRATHAARETADLEKASDTAPASYSRAQSVEAEAEVCRNRNAYDEARQRYLEAQRLYEEARDTARATQLRATAEDARNKMQTARSAAATADAAQFAAAVFRQAQKHQADAERALTDTNFSVAHDLFTAALQAYERAARLAPEERLRQAASAARDEARRSQEAATQGQASQYAPGPYREAVKRHEEAEAAFAAQVHEQAAKGFRDAADLFRQAATEAERERQRLAVEAARVAAHAAEQEAQRSGGPQHCAQQHAAALTRRSRAERDLAAEDLAAARRGFEECAALFREVTQEARRCAQTEEAQRARADAHALQQRVRATGFWTKRRQRQSVKAVATGDRCLRAAEPAEALAHYQKALRLLGGLETVEDRTQVLPRSRPREDASGDLTVPIPSPAAPSTEEARRRRVPLGVYVGGGALAAAVLLAVGLHMRVAPNVKPLPVSTPIPNEPSPPPAPRPPLTWQQISPAEPEQTIKEGADVRFAVAVRDPESYRDLQYVWLLDGHEKAHGSNWEYQASADEGGVAREVKVIASEEHDKIEQSWHVHVQHTNRPPVIESASPKAETISLAAGAVQPFSVTASDPDLSRGDKLTYAWERDGQLVASGPAASWTLHDAAQADVEVKVTVTDAAGSTAPPRTWKLAVAQPPPPPVNLPPRILSERPNPRELVTRDEGGSEEFQVRADNPSNDQPLVYAWFLDGHEVGKGATWRFTAPAATAASAAHKVEVEVATRAGLKAPRVVWNVEVKATPPKIVDIAPRAAHVSLFAGESREFSVSATTRTDDDRLRHEWAIDGSPTAATQAGRFQLPATLAIGTHDITVAAVDTRGLRSAPHRWTVEIRTKPSKPPAAEPLQLSDADVRSWLARYQDAWQRKDDNALRGLGVVSSDSDQAALRRVFANYGELHVSIRNETIQLDGKNATVSFDRTDSDETGKKLSLPRQTYYLEKGANGVVASRSH